MERKPSLRSHLHEHTYPPLFWRFPKLVRLFHFWNNLVLQRNWVVRPALLKELGALAPGSLVIDAGCGDGQHLFFARRRFPQLQFLGIDKNAGNIAFCKRYAGQPSLRFSNTNLEDLQIEQEANFILCTGTLQYIEDDCLVLENFFKALKINGKLLLYVPVNGRTVLPFYSFFFKKWNHYEKQQNRRRIYSSKEVLGKTGAAGFTVRWQRFTYGSLGIAGHEIYHLLLMGVGNAGVWAWVYLPVLLLSLPLVLCLKRLDFLFPKKTGNGMLLLAEKKR
jgi:ubiquinone/menaquinone biosynthesis C-methylase UbiE